MIKPCFPGLEKFILLQQTNEQDLAQFLRFLDLALCKAYYCIKHNLPIEQGRGTMLVAMYRMKKINRSQYEVWLKDEEHGLPHGFMTAFFAYKFLDTATRTKYWAELNESPRDAQSPVRDHKCEAVNFILSAFLHDFIKATEKTHPRHDIRLKEVSEFFLDSAYEHSQPNVIDSLVKADRIELMRYPNYLDWSNPNIISPLREEMGREQTDHLYQHIRPAIVKLLTYRRNTWASHAIEWSSDNHVVELFPPLVRQLEYLKEYYPAWHWPGRGNYFSVCIGKLPFPFYKKAEYLGSIVGLIPIDLLKPFARISACPAELGGRDHPFVQKRNEVPIQHWVFLYTSIKHLLLMRFDKMSLLELYLAEELSKVTNNFLSTLEAIVIQ